MKFNEPFVIKVQPFYNINEPIQEPINVLSSRTNALGGLYVGPEEESSEGRLLLTTGGKFEWSLGYLPGSNENNRVKPLVNIQLMRLWCVQMFTQMVNGKSFVNEIDDTINFSMTEEESDIVKNVIERLTTDLNNKLEKTSGDVVLKKKNNFKFV